MDREASSILIAGKTDEEAEARDNIEMVAANGSHEHSNPSIRR